MNNYHNSSNFEILLNNISNEKPKQITNAGKPISHFTMVCFWKESRNNNLKWTYRGDMEWVKYFNSKDNFFGQNAMTNQLQALVKRLAEKRDYARKIIIYNNRAPKSEAVIYHYTDSNGEITNKIISELQSLENNKP